ncbi:MAG: Rieske (2Fe-2S) protein [Candidatus Hydrogenedentota bacterium]
MQFVRVANTVDFQNLRVKSFRILGKYIGIVREPDGSFYATEIMCKHNNADLTTGHFSGDFVTCSRHGWRYNIRTGECLTNNSTPLRRHALELRGEEIWVSMQPVDTTATTVESEMPEIEFRAPGN